MKYFRPLSPLMISKLKECRKVELDEVSKKHCTMEDMSYAVAPLFKRGLIEMKKEVIDNKVLECIHVTKEGIEYLQSLNPVENN